MSAPLFLVPALPDTPAATLDGPEGHHAADVQRVRPGERVVLADGRGGTAEAEVVAVRKGEVSLRVLHTDHAKPMNPALVVAQGLPKGDRGELAVQAMTEVGADEIIPWAASRSVTQWRGERGHRSRARWESTAREAAKQSRRAWLPLIGGDPDAGTKQVAARMHDASLALVLHEEATERLSAVPLPHDGEIVLVVGPEGGITDAELGAFVDAGATAVRLGDAVLRTSTAGVAALAVLSARLGRW